MQHNWKMDWLEEFVLHKKITFPKNEQKYICLSEGWWIMFFFVLDCFLDISALQIPIWLIFLNPYLQHSSD